MSSDGRRGNELARLFRHSLLWLSNFYNFFGVCAIDMQQVGPEEIVEFDDPQKSIGNSR